MRDRNPGYYIADSPEWWASEVRKGRRLGFIFGSLAGFALAALLWGLVLPAVRPSPLVTCAPCERCQDARQAIEATGRALEMPIPGSVLRYQGDPTFAETRLKFPAEHEEVMP